MMRFKHTAKGLVGLLGDGVLAGAVVLGLAGNAIAGKIVVKDNAYLPPWGDLFVSDPLNLYNVAGASEGIDSGDVTFINDNASLKVYSKIDGDKYAENFHPIATTGWDFYLSDNISPPPGETATFGSHAISIEVQDATDIINVVAYDKSDPNYKYDIPLNHPGGLYIHLSEDVPFGEFATWRIDINTPEPSSLSLLAMAGIAGAGVGVGFWRNWFIRRKRT